MYKITGCEYQINLIKKTVDITSRLEKGEMCAILDVFEHCPIGFRTQLTALEKQYVKPQERSRLDNLLANVTKTADGYEVILTDIDTYLLSQACELISRIMICQFDNIADYVSLTCNEKDFNKLWEFRDNLNNLKLLFGIHKNSSYGIFSESVDDDARCLWDMHQVIRNRLAYDANPGITPKNRWEKRKITVDFDEPMHSDKRFPLIWIYKSNVI